GCTCQSRVRSSLPIAHGAAGAVGARPSLRPLLKRGPMSMQDPGEILSRDREAAPPSSSCTAAKNLHAPKRAGQPLESSPMSSQTMPSDTEARAKRAEEAHALEEDARLRNDIRLLGRILGDTVRDQEGAEVFDLVERIRQTSIRFHRDEDRLARRELE